MKKPENVAFERGLIFSKNMNNTCSISAFEKNSQRYIRATGTTMREAWDVFLNFVESETEAYSVGEEVSK